MSEERAEYGLSVQKSTTPQNGMITTATTRQAQEVQAAIVIAKSYPRDQNAARNRIMQACERESLAEVAIYEYPRGGTKVEGASIRLAEAIAQNWGNLDFGIVELEQGKDDSSVMAYAWDLENNTRQMKTFTVPHRRDTRNGSTKLESARDIYEVVANQAARRLRACILGIIPGDVVEEAVATCNRTLTGGEKVDPKRIAGMIEGFAEFKVTEDMIKTRLGHNLDACTASELAKLRKVYQSIRDGMGGIEDFFKPSVPKVDPKEAEAEQLRVALIAATDAGVPDDYLDDQMTASETYDIIKTWKETLDAQEPKEAATTPVEQDPVEDASKTTPEKTEAKAAKKEALTTTLERVASKMDQAKLVEQIQAMFEDESAVSKAAYMKAVGFKDHKTDMNTADIGRLRRLFVMITAEKQNEANKAPASDELSFA